MVKLVLSVIMMVLFALVASCSEGDTPLLVSMSALLSSPKEYDGKKIIFVGFLGRGADVYLTEDLAVVDDRSSSLILGLEDQERVELNRSVCKGRYVEVTGKFGVVQISGLTPRIGLTHVSSVTDKLTQKACM